MEKPTIWESGYTKCFVCGPDNPDGLHLVKFKSGNTFYCDFTTEEKWNGFPGITHGGFSAMVLDELMVDSTRVVFDAAVTAEMTIKYLSPAIEGHTLRCEAVTDSHEGRKAHAIGTIVDKNTGKLVAKGEGVYIKVELEKFGK